MIARCLAFLLLSGVAAADSVRILRDPWGVPHVLAESDYAAMYGLGWAVGEDQLVEALSALWTAQGRRSEVDGEDAIGVDRTMRLMRVTSDIEEAWPNYEESFRETSLGFAAGLNAYMRAHPDRVPSWAEPIHPAWPMALGRFIDFIPQIGRANGKARRLAPALEIITNQPSRPWARTIGSNGWAVGPSRTASGETILLTDPHLPWTHEFRLYESHVRGKTFECAGAGFVGVPMPQFARNAHLAWGWTWNGPDHADAYRLELDPDDSDRYMFDGESRAFEKREETFRLPDGTARTETLYESVHGPVSHRNIEEGYAVAYRLSAYGQTNGGPQYLAMLRAETLDELDEAMEGLQVCHFNQIAADSTGSIRYLWGGRIPQRPAGVNFKSIIEGTTSATLWDADDVVRLADLPGVRDPECGFVQNCNNSPQTTTLTKDDPQPESFLPGVVRGGGDTLRAWYLRSRLADPEVITVELAREIATDGHMIPHGPMSRLLKHSWHEYGGAFEDRELIAKSIEEVLAWNGKPILHSPVPTLFTMWLWKTFNETIMLPVNLMETPINDVDEAFARRLFAGMLEAQKELKALVPFARIPWGMFHVIQRNNRVWPVETGMYPAISLMNANIGKNSTDLKDLGCVIGSAYVGFHVFTKDGIRSESVMPLGQTDDPSLDYVDAMTDLFAERRLKPLPFSDAEMAEIEMVETVLHFDR